MQLLFVVCAVRDTRTLSLWLIENLKFELFFKILPFLDNFSNRWPMPVASSWSKWCINFRNNFRSTCFNSRTSCRYNHIKLTVRLKQRKFNNLQVWLFIAKNLNVNCKELVRVKSHYYKPFLKHFMQFQD